LRQVSDCFVERLTLIQTLPCLADPGKIIVVGRPARSLAAVLPYINAILPNVLAYSPTAGTMTLRRQPGFITLYPDKVYITQVKDTQEGLTLLQALCDLLNQVWARRDEIVPLARPRKRPGMLDVWKLLPKSNCRVCGQQTCMAFAVGLLLGEARLRDCRPLLQPDAAGQYAALTAFLPQEVEAS
jgi:ArsR family metal-binding transcriptional regulator